jgi:hypothetical protein
MSTFTLYELESYKYGSVFLKSKNPKNNFVIYVTKNKRYVVYFIGSKELPDAKEVTFFGHSRMTDELSKIDYAKRVVRKLFKRYKDDN